MWKRLRARKSHFWLLIKSGKWPVLIAYSALSTANFIWGGSVMEWREDYFPLWEWWIWAIGGLALLIFVLAEGSYRLHKDTAQKLSEAHALLAKPIIIPLPNRDPLIRVINRYAKKAGEIITLQYRIDAEEERKTPGFIAEAFIGKRDKALEDFYTLSSKLDEELSVAPPEYSQIVLNLTIFIDSQVIVRVHKLGQMTGRQVIVNPVEYTVKFSQLKDEAIRNINELSGLSSRT